MPCFYDPVDRPNGTCGNILRPSITSLDQGQKAAPLHYLSEQGVRIELHCAACTLEDPIFIRTRIGI